MDEHRISNCKALVETFSRVIVAYSGGVDSSLLLRLCVDLLGKNNVLAVTGISQTYTDEEKKIAQQISGNLGIEHLFIYTDELSNEQFANNPKNRCYYCKKELYGKISDISKQRKIQHVLDATNADDLQDYRPGRKAAEESGVKSPFVISGITKEDIRELSFSLGLSTWDKPANPCLASRVPYGIRITDDILRKIEAGERFLKKYGLKNIRLRHHNNIARIEIDSSDFSTIIDPKNRTEIINSLKNLGYRWITFDIEGFRSGNLNV